MKFAVSLLACLIISYISPAYAEHELTVSYLYNQSSLQLKGVQTSDGYQFKTLSHKTTKQPIEIVTLDWPPYISQQLCNKGWAFQLAIAVLTSQGYDVNIRFLPWSRAVLAAEQGKVDILFPEYFIEESAPSDYVTDVPRHELLALSRPLPGGNIVFMKRKETKNHYDGHLDSIKDLRIGVVRGYQNFPEFDALVDSGKLSVLEANSDLHLMKLLIGKRVDLVIGDPKVLRHTVVHSQMPQVTKNKILNNIEEVQPELQYNPLFFAVSKNRKNWSVLLNSINQGLHQMTRSGEINRIIKQGSQCH